MIVVAEIVLSGEDYVSKKALKRFRRECYDIIICAHISIFLKL